MKKCYLKEYLEDHHLDQKDLARMSGLTEAMISRIIRGNRCGTLHTWFLICAALNCSIYDIWR